MTILAFLLAPEGERVLALPAHLDVIRERVWRDDAWLQRCVREGYTSSQTNLEPLECDEITWRVLLRDETSALYTREVPT